MRLPNLKPGVIRNRWEMQGRYRDGRSFVTSAVNSSNNSSGGIKPSDCASLWASCKNKNKKACDDYNRYCT